MEEFRANINLQRSIDISYVNVLLGDVFGFPALPFTEVEQETAPDGISSAYTVTLEDTFEYDNAPVRFGQKTWGAFWLEGGKYKSYNHKGELEETEYTELLMPLASLVSFSKPKKVTEVNEVIEVYMMRKWSINIQVIIINDKDNPVGQQTVIEQMEALQKFHEVAGSVGVKGQLFADREITRLVTLDLKFDPIQGKPGMMQYSLEAVSDNDFLLIELI